MGVAVNEMRKKIEHLFILELVLIDHGFVLEQRIFQKMLSNSSLNLDRDYGNIVTRIEYYHNIDLNTVSASNQPEINLLFNDPNFQAQNRFFPYMPTNESIKITRFDSEEFVHPEVVRFRAQHAKTRVYLSVFPEISLIYCIIDNTFLYWKLGETRNEKVFELKFDGTEIRAVTLTAPKNEDFYAKNVKALLVIATDAVLTICPIATDSPLFSEDKNDYENAKSFFDPSSFLSRDVKRYCLTTLASSSDGNIFAGSMYGTAYIISYDVNKFNVTNLMIFRSFPPKFHKNF